LLPSSSCALLTWEERQSWPSCRFLRDFLHRRRLRLLLRSRLLSRFTKLGLGLGRSLGRLIVRGARLVCSAARLTRGFVRQLELFFGVFERGLRLFREVLGRVGFLCGVLVCALGNHDAILRLLGHRLLVFASHRFNSRFPTSNS